MAWPTPVINGPAAAREISSVGVRGRRRGFTVFEALAAAVVLAITMAGICDVLAADTQQSITLQQNNQAVAMGRELLDEIASKPLANPSTGLTTPATATASVGSSNQPSTVARANFVAVGDYNGYFDSGEALYSLSGTATDVTGSQNFTRSVTVSLGAKPAADTNSPATDFGLVTVTVTTPSGKSIQLQRVVANYTFSR
jgi:Tfp pilus assembly protein PilV